ncbi:MAG: TetR/AcrR family transcriptional regulator [Candidatus Abyssobacteria bacterium SURF_17]|jgi:TetR/AcrR family transcriptional repressor of nem operon|uniref:TetR/AcrR family transcriptional regulator n=1 Tax=Candidatus Abyssobacteria bacterium SURF_17 TaxID=2093361 RepID=A0A419EZA8_9BACT|nr:MAG: TetR/AcrR family transcriptional regulator [Candidatus Abyssubacteria bacterium SURF_17]
MTTVPLEKGKLTRDRIVWTAAELFRKNGFHNTSLSQILKAARLTKGGFYFHFRSKEELGDAVIEYMREFWIHNVLEEVEKEKGALKKIERMFEIMIKTHEGNVFHGCALLAVLTAEMMEVEQHFSERLRKIYANWKASIVEILGQGKREGLFKESVNPDSLALLIIGTLQGTTMMAHLDPEHIDLSWLFRNLRSLLLEGVAS